MVILRSLVDFSCLFVFPLEFDINRKLLLRIRKELLNPHQVILLQFQLMSLDLVQLTLERRVPL